MRPFDDLTRLERVVWLDKPAAAVRTVVQRALSSRKAADALHGVWLGHPLHPGAAQLALGFFTSAAVLDALPGRRGADSRSASSARQSSSTLIGAGLVATLPSVASGWADWAAAHEDQQRVGLVHAAANGVAVGLFARALIARRRGRGGRTASVAGGAVAGVAALLGGHMGYRQALGANHAEHVTHLGPADWTTIGALADLPQGEPVRRTAGTEPVVAVRRGPQVTVLSDTCPHLSAPMSDGELVDPDGDARLVCPWHGSEFRLADGCVVHGPATASLPRFESRISPEGMVEARVVPIPGVAAAEAG